MNRPALVHVSTCFVAGNRSGPVWESDPVVGYFPRREELQGVEFDVVQEIRDCAKLSERVKEEAKDAMWISKFRDSARKRLYEEGRAADDPDALGLAVARERKVWTRTRLTELGMERAAWWAGRISIHTPRALVSSWWRLRPGSFAQSFGPASSNRQPFIHFRDGTRALLRLRL